MDDPVTQTRQRDWPTDLDDLIPADVPAYWRKAPRGIEPEAFHATLLALCRMRRPRDAADFFWIRDEVIANFE